MFLSYILITIMVKDILMLNSLYKDYDIKRILTLNRNNMQNTDTPPYLIHI